MNLKEMKKRGYFCKISFPNFSLTAESKKGLINCQYGGVIVARLGCYLVQLFFPITFPRMLVVEFLSEVLERRFDTVH